MSMTKGIQTVIMFGVLVTVVTVLGILISSLRLPDKDGFLNSTSYVIADQGLNGTVNTATQLKTSGTLVGVFVLVVIAVLMLGLLVGLIKKFGGGNNKGGSHGRQQPVMVLGR